jgi:predicted enzyme related to lactoylglutathione lyase
MEIRAALIILAVKDLRRSLKFYRDVFGNLTADGAHP